MAQTEPAPTSPSVIYKVKRDDGSVIYTDSATANATEVEFDAKTQNVVASPSIPMVAIDSKAASVEYKVVIDSPKPQATIRSNAGNLSIKASQPHKTKAPRYRLIFDNAPLQSNTTGNFALSGIDRGEHKFKVELTDNKGKTLASSAVQTLFLHQASVLINRN